MTAVLTSIAMVLLLFSSACDEDGRGGSSGHNPLACPTTPGSVLNPLLQGAAGCDAGLARGFPCSNLDILATLTFCYGANDVWGWGDPVSGREYALLGLVSGTMFVDVTEPEAPTVSGFMPTRSTISSARDIKTLGSYAYVVSEARNHGLQIFDLTRLRDNAPQTIFRADASFDGFSSAHNLAINEETQMGYVVGSDRCSGGLYMIDLSTPLDPEFVGCYSADRYTHDTQCVVYQGPDPDYSGREICFASNEDTLTIVDVSDKLAPQLIRRASYIGVGYAHQGWLSEDHRHFIMNDELDELENRHNTRTYIWDVSDLDTASVIFEYEGVSRSSDHNLYVHEDHVYEANYASGLRILRSGNLDVGELREIAYLDTVPETDRAGFFGAWTAYPYLASGTILVSDTNRGLFLLRADLMAISECDDGLDNDGDGAVDFAEDDDCESPDDPEE